MNVIRPIRIEDHKAFVELAQSASIGMSLQKNPQLLLKKIEESLSAFAQKAEEKNQHCYFFILENESKGVEGVAGLISKTAVTHPEYFYENESLSPSRFHPAAAKELTLLRPFLFQNGPSEICALFLSRLYRKSGLGRLLSLSRFLFMAAFPQRFEEQVIALMRGYFDEKNRSPFWEGVGRKFLDLDFSALLRLREEEDVAKSIWPSHPIYKQLLQPEVQAAIGEVHPNTLPALNMLKSEGFIGTQFVDFFDGGPLISAQTATIRTICQSRQAKVQATVSKIEERALYLISNEKLDFRALLSPLFIEQDGHIILSASTAKALSITEGDTIRYVTPH